MHNNTPQEKQAVGHSPARTGFLGIAAAAARAGPVITDDDADDEVTLLPVAPAPVPVPGLLAASMDIIASWDSSVLPLASAASRCSCRALFCSIRRITRLLAKLLLLMRGHEAVIT